VGHSKGGLFVKQMIVDGMYHLIRNMSVFFWSFHFICGFINLFLYHAAE
jgi:hypothetical protein